MKRASHHIQLSLLLLVFTLPLLYGQQHDKHWLGRVWGQYKVVTMGFDEDDISYVVSPGQSLIHFETGVLAMSDAAGELQFYTNGNVVVSRNHNIMQGGKGFNEGSPFDDFLSDPWGLDPDTVYNTEYAQYAYQLIPDPYDGQVYYMVHGFVTYGGVGCSMFRMPKMQISKIDMSANGGKGRVVYKNRYFDEWSSGGYGMALVRHGNGRDWWVVRQQYDGLAYHATQLHRDSVVQVVESGIPELSTDWFNCIDSFVTNGNLLDVSPDGSMLLDNYGVGRAKLLSFDRCSGEVSLVDTFATGITPLVLAEGDLVDAYIQTFGFSPSGRYLYGAGWAEFAQWDLQAPNIAASKVKLGGVPWALNDDQTLMEGIPFGAATFAHGPDGKIYNFQNSAHNVIEHPDEQGEASGLCLAADNAPVSCLGPDVPYYLFSGRHPNFRLGPLTGSGCDTILSSTKQPVAGSGYGVTASPTVASGQVEVAISLPGYGGHVTAEVQVVDMLGRVLHRHSFPPYAYVHTLDVSGWPAGLYNVVLLEGGRARAGARLVVAR